jgi:hypothetical protein
MQTRLIHGSEKANDTPALSPPIYQTSTFRLSTPEEGAELATQVAPAAYYTRYGNPNTEQVEILLAGLEGAEAAPPPRSLYWPRFAPSRGRGHAGGPDEHGRFRAGSAIEHQSNLHRDPDEPYHRPYRLVSHG